MSRVLGLFRHGDYDHHSGDLTREGEMRLGAVVDALRERTLYPDVLFHSTVKRAVQSATFVQARVAALSGYELKLIPCEAFNENRSYSLDGTKAMLSTIQGFSNAHHKIFVMTHLPEIMKIGNMINCGFSSPDKAELLTFDFGKTTWNEMQILTNCAGDVSLSAYPVVGGIMRIAPPLPKARCEKAIITRVR